MILREAASCGPSVSADILVSFMFVVSLSTIVLLIALRQLCSKIVLLSHTVSQIRNKPVTELLLNAEKNEVTTTLLSS